MGSDRMADRMARLVEHSLQKVTLEAESQQQYWEKSFRNSTRKKMHQGM